MALTAQQQRDVWRAMLGVDAAVSAFAKPDLSAAVVAADTWILANTAAFVAALPEPFKTSGTAAQKRALFIYTLMKQAGWL